MIVITDDEWADFQTKVNKVIVADTDNFSEVALLMGLDINTDLEGADLTKCDLSNIDFSEANLTRTDFTDAIVTGAIFSSKNGLDEETKQYLINNGAIFKD